MIAIAWLERGLQLSIDLLPGPKTTLGFVMLYLEFNIAPLMEDVLSLMSLLQWACLRIGVRDTGLFGRVLASTDYHTNYSAMVSLIFTASGAWKGRDLHGPFR